MSVRALARQYAHALFDVAQKNSRVDQVRRDAVEFDAIVASHDELRKAFDSPAVSVEQKKALLQAVIQAAGGATEEFQRLLWLLADRERLMFLPDVVGAFVERVMDVEQVVRAEVTTTVALETDAKTAMTSALSKAMGRHVVMTERVDPALIGGIVAKVGSVVFDGSVTRQIERLRAQLLADI